MTHLLHQKCRALEAALPMTEAAVHDHLAQVSGWHRKDGLIERTFSFKHCDETITFVNALA